MTDHIYWKDGSLFLLDQRKLPFKEVFVECVRLGDVEKAISKMIVRGAPLIGVTAAYGVAIGIAEFMAKKGRLRLSELEWICRTLIATRPTAVNLAWAVRRMERKCRRWLDNPFIIEHARKEAIAIHDEDVENNRQLSQYGAELIMNGDTILTHCNAGALATGGWGTALGVIRTAHEAGKRIKVFCTETRPYFQGARLTAYELKNMGVNVELVPDNHAGLLCYYGAIDKVIVGADRIVRNGDTANKVGTYMIALAAKEYRIPFYVAAPASTFDVVLDNGSAIEIEQRDGREVKYFGRVPITLPDIRARYYSFDVTPAKYITAFITEKGVVEKPFSKQIAMLYSSRS